MRADGSVDLEVGGRKRASRSLPKVVVAAALVSAMSVALALALVFSTRDSRATILEQRTQQLPVSTVHCATRRVDAAYGDKPNLL